MRRLSGGVVQGILPSASMYSSVREGGSTAQLFLTEEDLANGQTAFQPQANPSYLFHVRQAPWDLPRYPAAIGGCSRGFFARLRDNLLNEARMQAEMMLFYQLCQQGFDR